MIRRLAAGFVAAALAMPAIAGEADRGAYLFGHCYACHSLDPADINLPGPTLAGVLGRPAASVPDFGYSPAMIRAGADGLQWTDEALDAFIADPEAVIPGTWMGFPGMADPADRAALMAYIAGAADN